MCGDPLVGAKGACVNGVNGPQSAGHVNGDDGEALMKFFVGDAVKKSDKIVIDQGQGGFWWDVGEVGM